MLTEQERDTVFCLSLLAIVRKAKAAHDSKAGQSAIDSAMTGLKSEVRNILIEHLDSDQIAELAANDLAATIGRTLSEFCMVSTIATGSIDVDHIVTTTEEFCSHKLGREIKV